ncbi:hypothetical protein STRCI_008310 [Streptomyces cinnabarinus]|uniref:DUF5671 domain-containing protein n=1 Tax=Streptomyces cinnabarinus TaxID=67287 RepID=A0ABY7KQR4_9ACTN|nr:hypothetical protein [Streptomyces cinnabarinus]WAZ26694.1 hypothetical protein STRCI_008310 [Streptomyces cinnabarinus]
MSTAQPPETPEPAASSLRSFVIQAGATVAAQVSLLAALLFYFGWRRNQAFADYLGYSESQLNSTVQRYVLSSIPALFDPLLIVAGLTLVWRIANPLLERTLSGNGAARRRVCSGLASALAVVPACTWLSLRLAPEWWELGLPVSLTAGVLLACWGATLWSSTSENDTSDATAADSEPARPAWPAWSTSLSLYVLGIIVVLTFWTAGTFADIQGRGAAQSLTADLGSRMSVTIFSDKDLRLSPDGGVEAEALASHGAYRFRYQGLKLAAYSDGKLFLIPRGWSYDHPKVIVLPEQSAIRVEYVYP